MGSRCPPRPRPRSHGGRCLVTTLPSQSLITLCLISFRFIPWTQRSPKALVQACPKRSLGRSAARGRRHHIAVTAGPQRTGWEDWFCAAGEGPVKALTCCHFDSQALTVPGSHGPDGDGSCTSRGQERAAGGSEASGSAFVL
uniref:Cyclin Q n=1 Tax=Myotis myotis TaxID=51298 RepID=A0A7J7YD29_MYOMY|nr:cyclin Q [Myotis myotis]